MEQLLKYFNQSFLGITMQQYIGLLVVCIGTIIAQKVSQWLINQKLQEWSLKTKSEVDDLFLKAVAGPVRIVVYSLGILLIVGIWHPSDPLNTWLNKGVQLSFMLATFWFFLNSVDILVLYFQKVTQTTSSQIDNQLVPMLSKATKAFIWSIAFIMVIQNLGYSISGILAMFGIGGMAVAFAAKDTIAHVFGSVKILIDRPFGIGDWVKTTDGSVEGVVEDIGFLSTKIRTFAKTMITVPNSTTALFKNK